MLFSWFSVYDHHEWNQMYLHLQAFTLVCFLLTLLIFHYSKMWLYHHFQIAYTLNSNLELVRPMLAIFTLCYLTGKAPHEGTFSLKELINLNTAGDENTSVMSCHSDVLVSIFLSSGIVQTKYLWFRLYWSQAYFDGDTCVIKGNSSYCKVL